MVAPGDLKEYTRLWRQRARDIRERLGEVAATEKLIVAAMTYSQAATIAPWFLDADLQLDACLAAVSRYFGPRPGHTKDQRFDDASISAENQTLRQTSSL